ncbi:MAG TPA: type IV toxin-antitoxin system AbiEi family antitoxin domain-containing protein [Solirubrobacterales bacterium]|nr:type IV toxin-antitoxin system AbiEi family antitoxin domain-containing protein [Solirubrobacterales bacterium]
MARKGSTRSRESVDWLIADVAERQHGVVARRQLRERGVTNARIEGRIRRGQLYPLHRGVYSVGHRVVTREARWLAAVLACGDGAVLSHRSAAQLWGLARPSAGAIHVTRAVGWKAPDGIRAHRAVLPDDERATFDGIAVTTVPRVMLDLAGECSPQEVQRAINQAEVLRLTDPLSLPDLLERYPGRRGTARLRTILGDETALNGPTRNDFEDRFAALLDAHGLPNPRFNADLVVRGRHFNVDCLWAEERLIVELDGGAVHRTARAFEADRERDRILGSEGWQVARVTWRQLNDDADGVVDDLRRTLRRRGARPPTL